MGGLSIWHLIALAVIALLLFGGRGRLSDMMGDFAKGIRSFREGLKEPEDPKTINGAAAPTPAPDKEKTTVGQ